MQLFDARSIRIDFQMLSRLIPETFLRIVRDQVQHDGATTSYILNDLSGETKRLGEQAL